jgi:hypothetical protein
MRFCSASGIAPAEVDEIILERFKGYRAQSGPPADDASGRRLVSERSRAGLRTGLRSRRSKASQRCRGRRLC